MQQSCAPRGVYYLFIGGCYLKCQKYCPPMQLHFSPFAQLVICGLRCFCYQRPVLDVDWRSFDLNIGLLLDSHFINKVWINRNWGERNIFSLRQNNFSNEKAILGGFWEATNRFWISTHHSENKFDGWHMKVLFKLVFITLLPHKRIDLLILQINFLLREDLIFTTLEV